MIAGINCKTISVGDEQYIGNPKLTTSVAKSFANMFSAGIMYVDSAIFNSGVIETASGHVEANNEQNISAGILDFQSNTGATVFNGADVNIYGAYASQMPDDENHLTIDAATFVPTITVNDGRVNFSGAPKPASFIDSVIDFFNARNAEVSIANNIYSLGLCAPGNVNLIGGEINATGGLSSADGLP